MVQPRSNKRKLGGRTAARLEKKDYPSGVFSHVGENLRVLTQDGSAYVPAIRPADIASSFQCIAVPTRRSILKNRNNIQRILRLAVDHGAGFVLFLCSGPAKKEDLAVVARDFPQVHWMAVDGPFTYEQQYAFQTTQSLIAYGSSKDIAQKRNLALQLARLMGWETLFFLDDDVDITLDDLTKAASLLQGDASVVGFSVRDFPDNSVVVQAGLWTHAQIDSFIGTGALAIKMTNPYLSFFPHVYNEDWLFLLFYCLREEGGLTWAGTLKQKRFNPFENTKRAKIEEPGDLLGESLMRLAMSMKNDRLLPESFEDMLAAISESANESFWEHEINERILFIRNTEQAIRLKKMPTRKKKQVLRSLAASLETLIGLDGSGGLQAAELAAWVRAWVKDIRTWNSLLAQEPQCTNVCDALAYLDIDNPFIYSSGKGVKPSLPPVTEEKSLVPTDLAGLPNIPRSDNILQGLRYTKIIQEFLRSKGRNMSFIFDSAQQFRFDRPIEKSPIVHPSLTIGMFVACDEYPGLVSESVRNIRQWLPEGSSAQIIIWAYSMSGHTLEQLDTYRNSIIARLIPEVAGSSIYIRSAILAAEDKNIDYLLDDAVEGMISAYWKYNATAGHPVYVVNSKNEVLRKGTFWEFVQQRHAVPSRPLSAYLRSFEPEADAHPAVPISPAQDEQAVALSRANLASQATPEHYGRRLFRTSATKRLQKIMRRAGLQWLQVDDLAYNIDFHDAATFIAIEDVYCLPVAFRPILASDVYAAVQEVIETIAKLKINAQKHAECMIVVYGTSETPWEQMQLFRTELMRSLRDHYHRSDILFTSFVCHPDVASTLPRLKSVSKATAVYAHWLENTEKQPRIHLIA